MKDLLHIMMRMTLLVLLILPVMANKSCGSAGEDAEKTSLSETDAPDETGTAAHSDKLPVLPEDPVEAEQILKSGGPEIISVPTGDK